MAAKHWTGIAGRNTGGHLVGTLGSKLAKGGLAPLADEVFHEEAAKKRLTVQDLAPVACGECGHVPRSAMARKRDMTWDGSRYVCSGKVNCAQRAAWTGE